MNIRTHLLRLAALVGFALVAYAPAAHANTYPKTKSTTLNVSAQVDGTCVVGATPLTFPLYDPVVTSVDKASTFITVQCTPGTGYEVLLNKGQHSVALPTRNMEGPGAHLLQYVLSTKSNCSNVWGDTTGGVYPTGQISNGTDQVPVFGCIAPNQGNLPDGLYSDQVTVTLNFN